MKIGISYGSLEVLKTGRIKEDSPKTLYLLTHGKCQNNCAFCSQARESSSNSLYLSRIIWPPIEDKELSLLLKEGKNFFKRICIQSTKTPIWQKLVENLIPYLRDFNLPISLSAPVEKMEDLERFFNLGIDRINISLDVASPRLFYKMKEKSWEERISLIEEAGKRYKGKITTHIIIGLGEKEKEALEIINKFIEKDINIALFAFTSLSGTKMENNSSPDYLTYRKIQIITYLLKKGLIKFKDLSFDENGRLIIEEFWLKKSYSYFREIFLTSGCPHCNRPYYNERPKITPYNFPRPIKEDEIKEIINLFEKGKCLNSIRE